LSNTTRLPILILGLLIAASTLAQDKPVEKSTTTPATPAVKSERNKGRRSRNHGANTCCESPGQAEAAL
jgi:hypothetical protein